MQDIPDFRPFSSPRTSGRHGFVDVLRLRVRAVADQLFRRRVEVLEGRPSSAIWREKGLG